jgi:hypothetical protein
LDLDWALRGLRSYTDDDPIWGEAIDGLTHITEDLMVPTVVALKD